MVPEPIKQFIEHFSRLPSIGPRLATRLAFHLLSLDRTALRSLGSSLTELTALERCPRCFFFKDAGEPLCSICASPGREPRVIAIVEKETDLLAIERTGRFHGHYLILGELPERGVLESVHRLRLAALKDRIAKECQGKAQEVIVALNLNTFGDFIADLIRGEFKGLAEKITQLGRGIPTGGEIEFADEETLTSALERRS